MKWIIAILVFAGGIYIYTTLYPKLKYEQFVAYAAECNNYAANSDAAIKGCTAIIDHVNGTDQNTSAAYLNRGNAYLSKGQLDNALADYNHAIHLSPSLYMAYINRGTIYDKMGQADKAIEDADTAIRLDPNLGAAYDTRGNAKLHKGDKEGGEADIAKSKELGITPVLLNR